MWATACPDCGTRVYFFSCTCGSAVFFNLPHPPWDPHQDECIPYLARYLRDVERRTPTSIRQLVERYAADNHLPIPKELYRRFLAEENRATGRMTVFEVAPDSTETTIVGDIIGVNRSVNFFKRLGYPEGPVSRGILGDLAKEPYVEVIIREVRDPETGFSAQATCFFPKASFDRNGLRQGRSTIAYLRSQSLPNGSKIWIADDLYGK